MNILLQHESHTPQLEGIARLSSELLRRKGHAVDLVDLGEKQIRTLEHHQAVVLLTSIWWGKLSRSGSNFITRNRGELLQKPFAIIVSTYHGDDRFQQVVSKSVPPDILEHAMTYKVGMNVNYDLLNPVDKLRWSVTRQRVESPYNQNETQAVVNSLFD